jgi:prepilin-type N-terminal cleavage/methylation domain-containing protein
MSRVDTTGTRTTRRGFGLIELLVAMAIVAILTATALPSFREMSRRMNVSEYTNNVVAALNTAKASATKLGAIVGLVGSGNNWSAGGFVVRADSNYDNTLTTADTLIAQYPALASGYTLKTKVSGGSDAQIIFGLQGSLATPITAVDVNVCRPDANPAQSSWVHVAPSGIITTHKNTAGSPAPGC